MPYRSCRTEKGKSGVKWGKRGKCYPRNKIGLKRAFAQAYAIYKSGGGEKPKFPKKRRK